MGKKWWRTSSSGTKRVTQPSYSELEAKLEAIQGFLWFAEAEYKRKLDTSAMGSEWTWEEVADFMWEQIREALATMREE